MITVRPLVETLRAGETIVSAWVSLPDPLVSELVARSDFGVVTLDVQHGLHDAGSVMRCIGGVALAGKPSLVRLAVDDFAMASRALDFGAGGVIAPMINSVADARRLVAATKYPPLGERSWGPARAMALSGELDQNAYLTQANDSSLTIAMIETRTAFDALDDILAIDGIDGVFVGPSDLSVALSGGAKVAPDDSIVDEPIREIARHARGAGKLAGAYAGNGARVRFYREAGYHLVALASDQIYLARGISAMLADVNGSE